MVNINGIITAMVTPMHNDETVNYVELRNQVRRQVSAGVSGLFVSGTNGESYVLSEKEKLEILKVAVDENAGKLPVYAGTGCPGTKETIELSKQAEKLGADVLSVITPYFATLSQKELYDHYEALVESVSIPIVVYNMPARTGVAINPETVEKLAKLPNIAGVKDSSGNFDNILQYIERTSDDFAVLSGNDSLVLWTLQAGGKGAVCGVGNLFPETLVAVYELWKAGDFAKAKAAQDSIRDIRDCFKFGNPNTIVKITANLLGHNVGPCRAPFHISDPKVAQEIDKVLKEKYAGMK